LIAGSQILAANQLAGILMMCGGGLITLAQAGRGSAGKRRRRPHPNFRRSNE